MGQIDRIAIAVQEATGRAEQDAGEPTEKPDVQVEGQTQDTGADGEQAAVEAQGK